MLIARRVTNTPGYLTPATLYGGAGFDAPKKKVF
jgi:hypothetical protein